MSYPEILAILAFIVAGAAALLAIMIGVIRTIIWAGEKVDHSRPLYYAVNTAILGAFLALIALILYIFQPR